MKQLRNILIDFVLAFIGAYLAQLQTGNGAITSLWALLAAALVGGLNALNPANGRYGIGAATHA